MFARGPLIALANPTVKAALIGAARDVATQEDWQDVVLGYLARAGAIVCFYGRTPSLAWETDQIVAHDKLARTIIVFPPASAQRRSFIEPAPTFAAALGPAHSKEEDEARDQALALVYDRQSQCYRILKSNRLTPSPINGRSPARPACFRMSIRPDRFAPLLMERRVVFPKPLAPQLGLNIEKRNPPAWRPAG